MGNVKVRYLVSRPRKSGIAWYWQPTKKLIANGFLARRLSDDLLEAIKQAERLNAELDRWYAGSAPILLKPDSIKALVRLYRASDTYGEKAARTQLDYDAAIKLIDDWCGDFPVKSLTRRAIKEWMRELEAKHGKRTSQKTVMTLAALLTFALDEDWIDHHPAREMKIRLGDGRQQIWTADQVRLFNSKAKEMDRASMALAVMLAYCQPNVKAMSWRSPGRPTMGSTSRCASPKRGPLSMFPRCHSLRPYSMRLRASPCKW